MLRNECFHQKKAGDVLVDLNNNVLSATGYKLKAKRARESEKEREREREKVEGRTDGRRWRKKTFVSIAGENYKLLRPR